MGNDMKRIELMFGDCMDLMRTLPDASVDLILCDLPYGTTACAWDVVIPFDPMWAEYHRIAKPNAAIVLHSNQPFTSALILSNLKNFRYTWVWEKQSHLTSCTRSVAPAINMRMFACSTGSSRPTIRR